MVCASGECLRGVLATKTRGQVLGKLEEICLEDNLWHLYLEPFKPREMKVRDPCYAVLWQCHLKLVLRVC